MAGEINLRKKMKQNAQELNYAKGIFSSNVNFIIYMTYKTIAMRLVHLFNTKQQFGPLKPLFSLYFLTYHL